MEKLTKAIEIVKNAGAYIRTQMHQEIEVKTKSSHSDFVTNIDKGVEKQIVTKIQKLYPEDGFLTEEKVFDQEIKERLWVLDPIDGTTNLIYQRRDFAISLAYFEEGIGVFGIIYDVMDDRMIWGHKDQGACDNGMVLSQLNQDQALIDAVLYGDVFRPHFFKESPEVLKPQFVTHRFLGSAAIEISNVACGMAQAYVFPKVKLWDIAASLIILECVGGTWRTQRGIKALDFNDEDTFIIASSNEKILEGIYRWL